MAKYLKGRGCKTTVSAFRAGRTYGHTDESCVELTIEVTDTNTEFNDVIEETYTFIANDYDPTCHRSYGGYKWSDMRKSFMTQFLKDFKGIVV